MFRIYAKLIRNNKVKSDYIYDIEGDFAIHSFFDYVQDICGHLDVPTPIILTQHIKNFLIFDGTSFSKEDFVETFPYDQLVIEIFK